MQVTRFRTAMFILCWTGLSWISVPGFSQILPPANARQRTSASPSSGQLPPAILPAPKLAINPPPPDLERHALEIFNGVSPQARSWILEEARTIAGHSALSVDAIGFAANQRFGSRKQLSTAQQDALALAVLYQVLKLDEQVFRSKTEQLHAITPASNSNAANATTLKDPARGTQVNGNPGLGSGDAAQKLQFEIQTATSDYGNAQALASSVDKKTSDTRNSVIGKL